MNTVTRWRLRWLFNRRVGAALQWALLVFGAALVVNLVGIRVIGSITGWQQWLRAQAGYFFVWRLGVYGATAYIWWRTRGQLRQRSAGSADYERLRLIGVGAIVAVVVTESRKWLQHG